MAGWPVLEFITPPRMHWAEPGRARLQMPAREQQTQEPGPMLGLELMRALGLMPVPRLAREQRAEASSTKAMRPLLALRLGRSADRVDL